MSNIKYDHIYVVLRYDANISNPIDAVAGIKAYVNENEALEEAARLKRINQSEYFVRLVRIQKGVIKKE
jgi:tRNA A37 threonylcarbamoyladenosine synthetase subunit TsaC/SUA5/YrdC